MSFASHPPDADACLPVAATFRACPELAEGSPPGTRRVRSALTANAAALSLPVDRTELSSHKFRCHCEPSGLRGAAILRGRFALISAISRRLYPHPCRKLGF